MSRCRWLWIFLLCLPLLLAGQEKIDWLPVTPQDLALKDNPLSPGSNAMILYRSKYTDDQESYSIEYLRIKIFTDAGKKHADFELPFIKGETRIEDIKARTIQPDGRIIPFNGQVFEKTVAKLKGFKYLAKTFTLPEVQAGSMIDVRYRIRWDSSLLLNTTWTMQRELFTRQLKLTLKYYKEWTLGWTTYGMPKGLQPQQNKDGTVTLTVENIPAFQDEEYSPPEDTLKAQVNFYYLKEPIKNTDEFWQRKGKEWGGIYEPYLDKRKEMAQAVTTIVTDADAPEVKLHKIYARVQKLRNLSFQKAKDSEKSEFKENKNIKDVWEHGYGYGTEINLLFVGLVRAAGMEASFVRSSDRRRIFFAAQLLDTRQLGNNVVWVRYGGQETYLDPGTQMCPYGLLHWPLSGVTGMKIEKDKGSFVKSPSPVVDDAVLDRRAELELDSAGTAKGKVVLTFNGQEALSRRLEWMEEDDAHRRKDLEDEMKAWLPASATVKLDQVTGWDDSGAPLRAEFGVEVPGWATTTGRRLLLPSALFRTRMSRAFRSAQRTYPIYFAYPFAEKDEINVKLPEGQKVETTPSPRQNKDGKMSYAISSNQQGSTLHLQRTLVVGALLFPVDSYAALRTFFEGVRAGDEEQIVLATPRGGAQ